MKIKVYPICSRLHDQDLISQATAELVAALEKKLATRLEVVTDPSELYDGDLALILVQSGGSEEQFIKEYPLMKEPVYLLTHGTNNSLAASIEILSYLKNIDVKAEILHGSLNYVAARIRTLIDGSCQKITRLGVLGKPSDWLIASNVNYEETKRIYGIELIDVSLNEVVEKFTEIKISDFHSDYCFDGFAVEEIEKAKKVYLAVKAVMQAHDLDGVTVRCFDLLSKLNTTACLALALLNSEGLLGTCEGDIPSMITMELLRRRFGNPGFQCNPSRIDVEENSIVLAHCTLPLTMCQSYSLTTHFESGIGIGIKGKLKEGDVTVFKISNDLKTYFVSEGKIVENLDEHNLCRSQIKVVLDEDVSYFLKRPCGNHHIVIYGRHKKDIDALMSYYL